MSLDGLLRWLLNKVQWFSFLLLCQNLLQWPVSYVTANDFKLDGSQTKHFTKGTTAWIVYYLKNRYIERERERETQSKPKLFIEFSSTSKVLPEVVPYIASSQRASIKLSKPSKGSRWDGQKRWQWCWVIRMPVLNLKYSRIRSFSLLRFGTFTSYRTSCKAGSNIYVNQSHILF